MKNIGHPGCDIKNVAGDFMKIMIAMIVWAASSAFAEDFVRYTSIEDIKLKQSITNASFCISIHYDDSGVGELTINCDGEYVLRVYRGRVCPPKEAGYFANSLLIREGLVLVNCDYSDRISRCYFSAKR